VLPPLWANLVAVVTGVPPAGQVKVDVKLLDAPPWQIVIPVVVGGVEFVKVMSSVDGVQPPLLIVHLNVTLDPAVTPVTCEVGDDGFEIVALPLTTLHAPVPVVGALPARVNVPLLQFI